MGRLYQRYRQMDYRLPATYRSWDLFGAGPENLGRDGKPVTLPLREPRDDELLLRVDAIGLCFSDTKLIWAGNSHPRITGRDLAIDPTVPGHEAAMTVARVGKDWQGRFSVGQRFIIQADIFVKGQQRAFGYVQRGALAQFAYAGPEVLAGDDGCYLLSMGEKSGYAEAALVEPWACVEDAYHIPARTAPKSGGRLLVAVVEAGKSVDFDGAYTPGGGPSLLVVAGTPAGLEDIGEHLGAGRIEHAPPLNGPAALAALVEGATGGEGFDDIVVLGAPAPAMLTAFDAALARHGCLVLVRAGEAAPAPLDVGRVHYHYTRHLGAPGGRIIGAYTANTREELRADGAAWMIGAAGPMGQMHMQRAIELDNPPAVLCGTDVNNERLAYLRDRLAPLAAERGVRLEIANPAEEDAGALAERFAALRHAAPEAVADGFDDVYVHAPVAALIEQGAGEVGTGGVLNVFAGVALGTMARLDPSLFTERHARLIGSSGSSMASFKAVFERMEAGRLATRMSLAALGGIEAGHEGILGVKTNRFPGKTVLFPALENLPLTGLDGLASLAPEAAALLERGTVWTNAAEESLLESRLALD